jgi:hypothetical protein
VTKDRKLVTRLVKDLYVECSLKTHNLNEPGTAMSDCCRRPAKSAVVDPKTNARYWRCDAHKGVLRMGEVVMAVDLWQDA